MRKKDIIKILTAGIITSIIIVAIILTGIVTKTETTTYSLATSNKGEGETEKSNYTTRLKVAIYYGDNRYADSKDFGTYDVYVNDKLYKQGVTSFDEKLPAGAKWEVKNLKLNGYKLDNTLIEATGGHSLKPTGTVAPHVWVLKKDGTKQYYECAYCGTKVDKAEYDKNKEKYISTYYEEGLCKKGEEECEYCHKLRTDDDFDRLTCEANKELHIIVLKSKTQTLNIGANYDGKDTNANDYIDSYDLYVDGKIYKAGIKPGTTDTITLPDGTKGWQIRNVKLKQGYKLKTVYGNHVMAPLGTATELHMHNWKYKEDGSSDWYECTYCGEQVWKTDFEKDPNKYYTEETCKAQQWECMYCGEKAYTNELDSKVCTSNVNPYLSGTERIDGKPEPVKIEVEKKTDNDNTTSGDTTGNTTTGNTTSGGIVSDNPPYLVLLTIEGRYDGKDYTDLSKYCTYDLYINGAVYKEGISSFSEQLPNGTKWEIKNLKAKPGYKVEMGNTQGTAGEKITPMIKIENYTESTENTTTDNNTTTGGNTTTNNNTTTGGDTKQDENSTTGGDTKQDGNTTTGGDTKQDSNSTTGGDTKQDGNSTTDRGNTTREENTTSDDNRNQIDDNRNSTSDRNTSRDDDSDDDSRGNSSRNNSSESSNNRNSSSNSGNNNSRNNGNNRNRSNSSSSSSSSSSSQSAITNLSSDSTTAKGILPKTGKEKVTAIVIIAVALSAIVAFIGYRKYKEI